MSKKIKNIFVEGAIPPEKIAHMIGHHQSKTNIGAHDVFLGQVRADEIDGKTVAAIEFTAHEEMALQSAYEVRERVFAKYPDLTCAHILHSLGTVKAGELCLVVFVSSGHRDSSFKACQEMTEGIKKEVAIFGKELFEDGSHQWKENKEVHNG